MLELKNITKDYVADKVTTTALKGVSLDFRASEFVAILGPSGCGKTTLLNIIGGLDRYTSGDLVIDNKSTKLYKDRDWDEYRNHKIGFVFQGYNLIPHQRVGSNVELALTIAGIDVKQRKTRVDDALSSVGMLSQIRKRPNQLSGGQMQRVAIARALITNPEIVLADEPTGALDSESSEQVMGILKKTSEKCLVIMVTHNPDLAQKYATRIISMKDGEIVDDSNPLSEEEIFLTKQDFEQNEIEQQAAENDAKLKGEKVKKAKRPKMSWTSAFQLSMANLYTKKMRTVLTTFAGSIGIIGMALVLAMSIGASSYVQRVQEDALSEYPLTINNKSSDSSFMAVFNALSSISKNPNATANEKEVYIQSVLSNFKSIFSQDEEPNDLTALKSYIDSNLNGNDGFVKYDFGTKVNIYSDLKNVDGNWTHDAAAYSQLNPFTDNVSALFASFGAEDLVGQMKGLGVDFSSMVMWDELIDNRTLLNAQYDVVAGGWPDDEHADGSEQNPFEIVLCVDENNQLVDYTLFAIGLKDISDVGDLILNEEGFQNDVYDIDKLLGVSYKLVPTCDYYVEKEGGDFEYLYGTYNATTGAVKGASDGFASFIADSGYNVRIAGVVRPKVGVTSTSIKGTVAYSSALTKWIESYTTKSAVYNALLSSVEEYDKDGVTYVRGTQGATVYTVDDGVKDPVGTFGKDLDMTKADFFKTYLSPIGWVDQTTPNAIYIYCSSFEGKGNVISMLDSYKATTGKSVSYTDTIEILMSTVTQIINAVTYVLIGFAAISLVVSSIMIAIITYTSVVERTREIGVLRSLGASKHDIANIFNSETLMEGFMSGIVGVFLAFIISLPLNAVVQNAYHIDHIVNLNWWISLGMVALSVLLSFIAGIIPSQIAAKRDPVVALRSE